MQVAEEQEKFDPIGLIVNSGGNVKKNVSPPLTWSDDIVILTFNFVWPPLVLFEVAEKYCKFTDSKIANLDITVEKPLPSSILKNGADYES